MQSQPQQTGSHHDTATLDQQSDPPEPQLHTPQVYTYLPDGQIRLFEIDLSCKTYISGHLQIVELACAPPFFALSYVCGSEPCTHEITVNNQAFPVKPNLYAALRRLQTHFIQERRPKVLFWIDAICIEQGDNEEKARQVRNMHGVFSGAEQVCVWLGAVPMETSIYLRVLAWHETCTGISFETEVHSFTALESLAEETDYAKQHSINWLRTTALFLENSFGITSASLFAMHVFFLRLSKLKELGVGPEITPEQLKRLFDLPCVRDNLISPKHSFWDGAYKLSELEWFQRVWTYQEIRLARSAAVFIDGWHADWKTVSSCTSQLVSAIAVDAVILKIDPALEATALPSSFERRALQFKWLVQEIQSHNKLSGILLVTRGRKSTIAKDKVYGAISLLPPDLRAKITIDYSKSDAEAFARASETCIEQEGFRLFSVLWCFFERATRTTKGLPSWCPDFQSEYRPFSPAVYPLLSVANARMEEVARHAYYTPSLDFRTITVQIMHLETISRCTTIACPENRMASSWRKWLQGFRDQFPPNEGPRSSLLSNMWSFLYSDFDRWRLGKEVSTSMLPHEYLIARLTPESFSKALSYTLSHLDDSNEWSDLLELFFHVDILQDVSVILHVLGHQTRRYLFETATGKIGFSFSMPTVGDTIVYVPGAEPLHIITGDRTQFVGCASVEGYMNDLLLDSLDEYDDRWVWVTLR